MFTIIFRELTTNFFRNWRLYLTNILAIVFVIMLMAYIDGSRRQLNLYNTVFSGEVVVTPRGIPHSIARGEFESAMLPTISVEDRELLTGYYEAVEDVYRLNRTVSKDEEVELEAALTRAAYRRVPEDFATRLKAINPELEYVVKKLITTVNYQLSAGNTGSATLIGVNLAEDAKLEDYLTLLEGNFPENDREILIPSSLRDVVDVEVGAKVKISGLTAGLLRNRAAYKVCGIYNAPGLKLLTNPKMIVTYASMEQFYQPAEKNISYSLFFAGGKVPANINLSVREAAGDALRQKIRSIEHVIISPFDVHNISVQFNVFMIIIIVLIIFVIVTIVIVVNFNINMILLRKRRREIGTLRSFGISSGKISLIIFLESFFQLLISLAIAVALCFLLAFLARQTLAGGFVEVLFVLLSGTNRIDFFIKGSHILLAFVMLLAAITTSQVPVFMRILLKDPIEIMKS